MVKVEKERREKARRRREEENILPHRVLLHPGT
jgi:hypothetical protein